MPAKLKVGMQLSIGGLGDRSFNDSAYSGLEEAAQLYDIDYQIGLWQDPERNTTNIENWVKQGYDLVIAVGFGNANHRGSLIDERI